MKTRTQELNPLYLEVLSSLEGIEQDDSNELSEIVAGVV